MIKKIVLTLLFLLVFLQFSSAQSWTFNDGGNVFDGKYRVATVDGNGGEKPYSNPELVLVYFENSQNLNLYIGNAGYSGCSEKRILVKFDDMPDLFVFSASKNADSDKWYFQNSYSSNQITVNALLKKMKAYQTMFIRLSSNCGLTDYQFPLKGSSKGIDYVAGDKIEEEIEEDKRVEASQKILDEGKKVSVIAKYSAGIFERRSFESLLDDLTVSKGSTLIMSNCNDSSEFCELIEAEGIDIPRYKKLYISRYAADLSTLKVLSN